MGTRSTFLSLAVVAGCYADADVEITAHRPDVGVVLEVLVCEPGGAIETCDKPRDESGNVFDTDGGLEQLISIFTDVSTIEIDLRSLGFLDPNEPRCITLALGEGRRRDLVLEGGGAIWSCPDGEACEDFAPCVQR